jgi:hypothetical protein
LNPLLPIALAAAPVILAETLSISPFVVPTFADLTIKKRHSFGTSSRVTTEVLYLKGARERREFPYGQPGNTGPGHATIMQCDQRRSVLLNPEGKVYLVSVLKDWSERFRRRRPVPEARGADVTTTFDAVDMGERRRVGRHVARRIRTTVTVEPSPGANTPASTRETDGWYIDLHATGSQSDKLCLTANKVATLYALRHNLSRGYAALSGAVHPR